MRYSFDDLNHSRFMKKSFGRNPLLDRDLCEKEYKPSPFTMPINETPINMSKTGQKIVDF